MTSTNAYLFELMTAGSRPSTVALGVATAFAHWAIWGLPLAAVIAWLGGTRRVRVDLLLVMATAVAAMVLLWLYQTAGCVGESAAGDFGSFLACWNDDGPVSLQVSVWWSVALALLPCGRLAWLAFPVLTMGLAVGWSIVYIGADFPLDVLRALPVAGVAALGVGALRSLIKPAAGRLVDWLHRARQPG